MNIFDLAAGTPYENGVFRMKLLLSHDFPHSPPKGLLVHIAIKLLCFYIWCDQFCDSITCEHFTG